MNNLKPTTSFSSLINNQFQKMEYKQNSYNTSSLKPNIYGLKQRSKKNQAKVFSVTPLRIKPSIQKNQELSAFKQQNQKKTTITSKPSFSNINISSKNVSKKQQNEYNNNKNQVRYCNKQNRKGNLQLNHQQINKAQMKPNKQLNKQNIKNVNNQQNYNVFYQQNSNQQKIKKSSSAIHQQKQINQINSFEKLRHQQQYLSKIQQSNEQLNRAKNNPRTIYNSNVGQSYQRIKRLKQYVSISNQNPNFDHNANKMINLLSPYKLNSISQLHSQRTRGKSPLVNEFVQNYDNSNQKNSYQQQKNHFQLLQNKRNIERFGITPVNKNKMKRCKPHQQIYKFSQDQNEKIQSQTIQKIRSPQKNYYKHQNLNHHLTKPQQKDITRLKQEKTTQHNVKHKRNISSSFQSKHVNSFQNFAYFENDFNQQKKSIHDNQQNKHEEFSNTELSINSQQYESQSDIEMKHKQQKVPKCNRNDQERFRKDKVNKNSLINTLQLQNQSYKNSLVSTLQLQNQSLKTTINLIKQQKQQIERKYEKIKKQNKQLNRKLNLIKNESHQQHQNSTKHQQDQQLTNKLLELQYLQEEMLIQNKRIKTQNVINQKLLENIANMVRFAGGNHQLIVDRVKALTDGVYQKYLFGPNDQQNQNL